MPNKNKTSVALDNGSCADLPFVSFAQNFEDVMLWRALAHIEHGFYIDIGAWSPEVNSVTKAFYDRGWNGINVEPNPGAYGNLLTARPRDINLQLAIADAEGAAELHIIRQQIKFTSTGLSTLSDTIAAEHAAGGFVVSERLLVETRTLASICRNHVPNNVDVHFLKIDVEGTEEAVIRGADWVRYRPWIVIVETTYPMTQIEKHSAWEPMLTEAGYACVYQDGLNRFYVAREHEELAAAFDNPPNVFDQFVLAAQSRAEARAAELTAQLARERNAARAQADVIEGLRHDLQSRSDQLRAIKSNWTWRLTSPLRSIRPAARRGVRVVARLVARLEDIFNWWRAVLRPDPDLTPRARRIHRALMRAIAHRRSA